MTRDILKKPTGAIHIGNIYTASERKMMNVCLLQTQTDGVHGDWYSVNTATLMEFIGNSETRNWEWLNNLGKNLISKTISWNVLDQDKINSWKTCTFLSTSIVNSQKFRFRLNPEIVDQLNNPKVWARFRMFAQVRMKSTHSVSLYEYFKDIMGRQNIRLNSREKIIFAVTLEELRIILGINETQYTNFKELNKKVFKIAKTEINEHSDINIDYSNITTGRKVTSLQFTLWNKTKKEFEDRYQLTINFPASTETNRLPASNVEENEELFIRLKKLGIKDNKISFLVSVYDADRIKRNIDYSVEQASHKGHSITNLSGYVCKAIEDNYKPEASTINKTQTNSKQITHNTKEKTLDELTREWEDFKRTRLRENYEKRSSSWKRKKKAEFRKAIKSGMKKYIFVERFNDRGFDCMFAMTDLQNTNAHLLLKAPEETSLKFYLIYRKKHLQE